MEEPERGAIDVDDTTETHDETSELPEDEDECRVCRGPAEEG
jgi:hypothetical protein